MTFAPAPLFFSKELTPAARAAADTGLFTSVVLAQWADETGYGTSSAWVYGNNPAGISPDGSIANYPSQAAGYAAYVETMNLDYYDAVRAAKEQGALAQAYALGQSPWAAGHYTGAGEAPGQSLVDIIETNDLTAYDGLESTLNPPPQGEATMPVSPAVPFAAQGHIVQATDGVIWHKIYADPPTNQIASAGATGASFPNQVPGLSVINGQLICTAEDAQGRAWLFAWGANNEAPPAPPGGGQVPWGVLELA